MSRSHPGIVADPGLMAGRPVIAGTRITVELILEELGDGMAVADIVAAHPHLREEDVRAARRFAADYIRNEDIQLLPPRAA